MADFKLLLIISGQQTATSMYPCPYCFVSLDDLKRKPTSTIENSIDSTPSIDSTVVNCRRLKTYGDLRADIEKYCLSGKDKKK